MIAFITTRMVRGGADNLIWSIASRIRRERNPVLIFSLFRSSDEDYDAQKFREAGVAVVMPRVWEMASATVLSFLFFPYSLIFDLSIHYRRAIVRTFAGHKTKGARTNASSGKSRLMDLTKVVVRTLKSAQSTTLERLAQQVLFIRVFVNHKFFQNIEVISAFHFASITVGGKIKSFLGIRALYTEISSPAYRDSQLMESNKKSNARHLPWYDVVISPSSAIGAEIAASYGYSKKVEVIPFIVEKPSRPVTDSEILVPSIGMIGRLTEEKGQLHLVALLDELRRKGCMINLILVGDGEDKARIRSRCGQLSLEQNVTILDDNPSLDGVMGKIGIYLSFSLVEGMSIALIEALSYGKPIITNDVGSNREMVVDGWNGYIISEQVSERTVEKIMLLFKDKEMARTFSRNSAILYRSKFEPSALYQQYQKQYFSQAQ